MNAPIKPRSQTARAALLRGGAGKHADRRTRRQRTRQAARTVALREQ